MAKTKTLNKTNIEWVKNPDGSRGYVWNPVWGCRNGCPYCYARQLAQRFGKTEDQKAFEPTWLQSSFDKSFPKKPSRIFVNSMSDICWWEREWMERVIERIKEYPEHIFQFLTKKQSIYFDYVFPSNCWLGFTVTRNEDIEYLLILEENINFISLEPLHFKIHLSYLGGYQWVIIGAETGNRKGKVIPQRKWIAEIVDYCKANQIPVFLKDSLREIWGDKLIQEFPEVEK